MSHIFIPDYKTLDSIRESYRLKGNFIKNPSEITTPGIFFAQKEGNEITLDKVDLELINKLIRTWDEGWN